MMFLRQLRNELWKMFGKRRTYLGAGMFMLAQSAIILLFHYVRGGPLRDIERHLENAGLQTQRYISALTIATTTLVATAYILLPLFVALVGGDLVAKEAEDGTLRMILCRPVSRFRLLLLKWAAGWCFSFLLVALIGIYGFAFARIYFPAGDLFVFFPIERTVGAFEGTSAWQHYAAAHVALGLKAGAIMTLALMFSCFNMKPAAATIVAIALIFISLILQQVPFFNELKPWFITYHLNLWTYFFDQPMPWWKVGESLSILGGYTFSFFIIGSVGLQLRDIKS